MVDAFHYAIWAIEHPEQGYDERSKPVAASVAYSFADKAEPSVFGGPARKGPQTVRVS